MTTAIAQKQDVSAELFDKLVLNQDLSDLTQQELVQYYVHVCKYAGLDPVTKPFDVLVLSGKKTLYANKSCTAQLTAIHKPSVRIVERQFVSGLCIVTAEVTKRDGSSVQDIGTVPMPVNAATDAGANAIMKATTKAKRRALLSAFGLGMLDEVEVEDVFGAKKEEIEIPAEATDSVVLDIIAQLDECSDHDEFRAIAAKIKAMSLEQRSQLGPVAVERGKALGLVFNKGEWKPIVEVTQ